MNIASPQSAQNKRKFGAFLRSYAPFFSINYIGLAAVRVWIQVDLYDRYTSVDSGLITIGANLTRVALMLVILAMVTKFGFSLRARKTLSVVSAFMMTVASALFLLNQAYESSVLLVVACFFAGFGIIWGAGMWICFYVRLEPTEALLYAFLSLAVSSFFGLIIGVIPKNLSFLIAMLMPVLSLIAYRRAQVLITLREKATAENKTIFAPASDTVYDAEPPSTFIRMLMGIAVFNFALGIARGFPSGTSLELGLLFQVIHQFGAVFLSLCIIAWALIWRRPLRFSSLWNITVTLIAAGVLALASMSGQLSYWGATLIAIANTFSLGLLWYSCYDIARHSRWTPYILWALGWLAHLFPREMGRMLIWFIAPRSTEAVALVVLIVLLLALSMALLLADSIPQSRPLFADFRTRKKIPFTPQPLQAEEKDITHENLKQSFTSLDHKLLTLKKHYFLTEREFEVVSLLACGRSKASIGQKLFLSENTVKTYTKNVYAKLNIHNKQELLDRIEEQGCVGEQ